MFWFLLYLSVCYVGGFIHLVVGKRDSIFSPRSAEEVGTSFLVSPLIFPFYVLEFVSIMFGALISKIRKKIDACKEM